MPEDRAEARLDSNWVRIHIFLPVNDNAEIAAAARSVQLVRNRYRGSTHSIMRPHIFEGWWWDPGGDGRGPGWQRDVICWLVVDIEPGSMEDVSLADALDLIRLRIADEYQQASRAQAEIWVITHEIMKLI